MKDNQLRRSKMGLLNRWLMGIATATGFCLLLGPIDANENGVSAEGSDSNAKVGNGEGAQKKAVDGPSERPVVHLL